MFISPLSEGAIKATQDIPMKYPCMYVILCTSLAQLPAWIVVKRTVLYYWQIAFSTHGVKVQKYRGRSIDIGDIDC